MKFHIAFAAAGLAASMAAACSNSSNISTANNSGSVSAPNTVAANSANATAKEDVVPAEVKAAFSNAQSFSTQHKDIPADGIAQIEKDAGAKVPNTDHHSFLAFSSAGGARKQVGAATLVTAGGKNIVVVYDSKNGSPVIKEIRGDGLPAAFTSQFAGKGHDDKLQMGSDLKANGFDEGAARDVITAIKIDVLTMQKLYGSAHTH